MAGFASVQDMVDDHETAGQCKYVTWRKTPSQTTAQGIWFDLSMSPGNPVPQYYAAAPYTSVVLARSTDGGIDHGGTVSPAYKFLRKLMAISVSATPVPMAMYLLDYLLFYPFIDESMVGYSACTTNATLTRYTSGAGVQMMAVVVGLQGGGQSFSIRYTNSAGVSGRTTPNCTINAQGSNGTIITSATAGVGTTGPFVPLQAGDTGVRYVEGVTVNGTGDYGVFTIVLVKPLANVNIRSIDAPVEVDYPLDFACVPRIYDDAYLNFVCCPNGSLAGAAFHGDALFTWG